MHISILHSLIYACTILRNISISQVSNFYKEIYIYTYQIVTQKEKKKLLKVRIYNRIKIIFNCVLFNP